MKNFISLNCRKVQGIRRCPRIDILFNFVKTLPKLDLNMNKKIITKSDLNSFVLISVESRWRKLTAAKVTLDYAGTISFSTSESIKLSIWLDLANKNLAFKLYRKTICSYFITVMVFIMIKKNWYYTVIKSPTIAGVMDIWHKKTTIRSYLA